LVLLCGWAHGADNGLALTPPMGWLSWERYECATNCNNADGCINEDLFKVMADRMVEDGYLKAGYDTVTPDDCWPAKTRDAEGKLQPDPDRFPSGIKALADYMHNKGLKFGIYEDYGTTTCAGYPGIKDHLQTDAETFAEWGVDYTKIDGCNAGVHEYDTGYPAFGKFMNATGRPIVYSCSWPDYQRIYSVPINWTSVEGTCNLWRIYNDIFDSWSSVLSIIDWFGDNKDLIQHAGPGHWNDPDMLVIGNFGLTYDQSRAQMAIWAILAAPLIMSVDLRTIRPEYKEILQNEGVIRVDQDPLGLMGQRVTPKGKQEVWMREVLPEVDGVRSCAVVVFNKDASFRPTNYALKLSDYPSFFTADYWYKVEDLFNPTHPTREVPYNETIQLQVNPNGGVVMLKFTNIGKSP